jgi:hypothetical protein
MKLSLLPAFLNAPPPIAPETMPGIWIITMNCPVLHHIIKQGIVCKLNKSLVKNTIRHLFFKKSIVPNNLIIIKIYPIWALLNKSEKLNAHVPDRSQNKIGSFLFISYFIKLSFDQSLSYQVYADSQYRKAE